MLLKQELMLIRLILEKKVLVSFVIIFMTLHHLTCSLSALFTS